MKTDIVPCTEDEMSRLMEAALENDFYYMVFLVAKTTGRRIGELYGSQAKREIGRKVVGKKIAYDENGNEIALSKTIPIYKKIPGVWEGGVQVKDIDFENGLMKVWVLKRRKAVQDETVLTKETLQTIKHYIIKRKLKPEDYLFREKSYRSIQGAVTRYAEKAMIEHKVSIHNFRHYFVTFLKKKGWTNDKITKLTGHKTPASLMTYDHVVAKDIQEDTLNDLRDI